MRTLLPASLIAVVMLAGCNKPKGGGNVPVVTATRPATAPTTTQGAGGTTRPVAPFPPTSTLIIDNIPVTFPPTKFSLEGPMLLTVFVKDPEQRERDYQGNRYYFRFRLDSPLSPQIPAYYTRIGPTSNSKRDEPDGIFLAGEKKQLQAHDAEFNFTLQGKELVVELSGWFLVFERDEIGPPQQSFVRGTLRTPVDKP